MESLTILVKTKALLNIHPNHEENTDSVEVIAMHNKDS